MIRKMTKTAMFAMLALSLMAFTATAQKAEKQEKAVAKTKEAVKKESAETGKRGAAPGLVHTGDLTKRPTIIIAEVVKRDAAAKQNPNGAGRLVPVDVRWDAKLPAGAKLAEMKCILRTKNTDGQTTVVEQLMSVEKFVSGRADGGTIMLPMPEGVFAKEFTLTMKGKFRIVDQIIAESVTKSGKFEIIAEKK